MLYNVDNSIIDIEQLGTQVSTVLGAKTSVVSQLEKIFPDLSFSDPSWGHVSRPGYSIEFNFGEGDPLQSIMLHIRGDDEVISAIMAMCDTLSWQAFDTTTSSFIHFENDRALGLRKWRTYRDRVIAQLKMQDEEVKKKRGISFVIKKKKWWQFWK